MCRAKPRRRNRGCSLIVLRKARVARACARPAIEARRLRKCLRLRRPAPAPGKSHRRRRRDSKPARPVPAALSWMPGMTAARVRHTATNVQATKRRQGGYSTVSRTSGMIKVLRARSQPACRDKFAICPCSCRTRSRAVEHLRMPSESRPRCRRRSSRPRRSCPNAKP